MCMHPCVRNSHCRYPLSRPGSSWRGQWPCHRGISGPTGVWHHNRLLFHSTCGDMEAQESYGHLPKVAQLISGETWVVPGASLPGAVDELDFWHSTVVKGYLGACSVWVWSLLVLRPLGCEPGGEQTGAHSGCSVNVKQAPGQGL